MNKSLKKVVSNWIAPVIFAIIMVLIVQKFLFQFYVISGDSMNPTLENGDRIIVDKVNSEVENIKRNNIILFDSSNNEPYVKRVIGTPGDKLLIKNNELYLNGTKQNEKYLKGDYDQIDFELQDLNGITFIPDNHLFVLGDNRNNSLDSRTIGLISDEDIIGKVQVRVYPFNEINVSNF